MKIERVVPAEAMFQLTVTHEEAHTVAAALAFFAEKHEQAVHRYRWAAWASDLYRELHRD